mmetsp:Transcript_9117/g.23888  ORF Transcript_9117/g.23888 Transcript_9117/m.23888 type:complete len:331 (-) Transcript_9117:380-1372(-)
MKSTTAACLPGLALMYVFASSPKTTAAGATREATAWTAARADAVARPSVSPWKEARRRVLPVRASTAETTSRSPSAMDGPPDGTWLMASKLRSVTESGSKRLFESRITEFWSALLGVAGQMTVYCEPTALGSVSRIAVVRTSCRKRTSVCAYTVWMMSSCLDSLACVRLSRICVLRTSHLPSGERVETICTRTASKMARHSVCSRTDIASSSSVSAGYLERGILPRSSHGSFDDGGAPFLPGTSRRSENIKSRHSGHHLVTVGICPEKLEITVGRYAHSPPTISIVFVMRSGIDISRLSPRPLSLRKPLTIGLSPISAHAAAHASAPSQP